MDDSGQFTAYVTQPHPQLGWLNSGGTVTSFGVSTAYSTLSLGINGNGDLGGTYLQDTPRADVQQVFVRTGGTCYPLNSAAALYGATITALNTAGQAVGWESHGWRRWSTDAPCGGLELHDFSREPGFAEHYGPAKQRLARRRIPRCKLRPRPLPSIVRGRWWSGRCTSALDAVPNIDTAYFLYNMSTQEYTSLGSLMLYDPIGATTSTGGGHGQAINNAGQVVGKSLQSGVRLRRRDLAKRPDHGPQHRVCRHFAGALHAQQRHGHRQ